MNLIGAMEVSKHVKKFQVHSSSFQYYPAQIQKRHMIGPSLIFFRMSHKIGVGTVIKKRTRIPSLITYPLGGALGLGLIGHMYSQHNSQAHRSYI